MTCFLKILCLCVSFLQALAKNDQIYRLQAMVETGNNKPTQFLTFMKAVRLSPSCSLHKIVHFFSFHSHFYALSCFQCALVESGLSDVLTISLDHSGGVVAVSSSAPFAYCQGKNPPDSHLKFFNTTIIVKHMDIGPV